MSELDRADAIIQSFQRDNPRLYDALRQLSLQIRGILVNRTIGPTITNPEFVFESGGFKRDNRFNTIELVNIFDRIQFGGVPGSRANGKLQVEENTNDNNANECITLKRRRPDTGPPRTGLGSNLSFRIQGFTIDTEPEAGRVQVVWENNQTDDTTTRDSELSLWNMLNNVLIKRFTISSSGAIVLDPAVYFPGRILYTGASGEIKTDSQLLYDEGLDQITIISAHASAPQLIMMQTSTGDAYLRFVVNPTRSYSFGIDTSDADVIKISTAANINSSPGTNDLMAISPAGQVGIGTGPGSGFKCQIDKGTGTESTILFLRRSDTEVLFPALSIDQVSTGDTSIRFTLTGGASYALGIDNSDNDNFKISFGAAGNARLGTTDFMAISTVGDFGIGSAPIVPVKVLIDKGTGTQSVVLGLFQNDANFTPSLYISQASTGDATIAVVLGAGASYSLGIDNSDADKFKLSFGSAADARLGVNDRLSVDISGRFVINGATFTTGRLLQLNHFEEGPWIFCESAFVNPAIAMYNVGAGGRNYQIISTGTGGTGAAGSVVVRDITASQNRLIIAPNGNFIVGHLAALATTATDGFLYIPSCAGVPTGVPTAFVGKIPLVYDSTNNILYAYSNAAWRAH